MVGGFASQGSAFARNWRRILGGVLIALCVGCSRQSARAAQPPTAPDAFTAFVAQQLREAAPQATFKVVAPLTLEVNSAHGPSTASLQNIYSACLRAPSECDEEVKTYLKQMGAYYGSPDQPLRRADLRVIVRPSAYVEAMRRNLAGVGAPAAAPLQGDFWVMAAADAPTTIIMLSSKSLAPLQLSTEAALTLGKDNMRGTMRRAITEARARYRPEIGLISGDPYQSSLMAFPDLWAPLAARAGGDLLVAVPASDVVLFCGDCSQEALSRAAEAVMAEVERPFSAAVFRWSPQGWISLPRARGKARS